MNARILLIDDGNVLMNGSDFSNRSEKRVAFLKEADGCRREILHRLISDRRESAIRQAVRKPNAIDRGHRRKVSPSRNFANRARYLTRLTASRRPGRTR